MGEPVRIRVVFEDAGLLRGSLRRRGLQRCWLQLRPGIVTIADLAAHLHETFGLHRSCPHGLIISMDGFVVPLFESTCILKDEDIIIIKKPKATNPVKPITTIRGIGNTSSEQTERISDKNDSAMKTLCCKEILYNGLGRVDAVVHSQGNGVQQVSISAQREVRNESKGNDDGHVSKNGANGDARKVQSRSASRKKAKKLWHRIHGSKKKKKMDGFVLPSFESTCILKDEDIIMIKKNGVMFEDIAKFCGSENQEQVLQSRQISAFNNRSLAIMDPRVDSRGDEDDMILCNGSTVHIETRPSEKMNEQYKRKRSDKLKGSNNTLAIKDSQEDSLGDAVVVDLHGNITHKETTSNEMVNAKRRKKHSNKHQTSDSTLANKDSQADSQGDKGDLGLPIPQKETSSSEMLKVNRKREHFDKPQGSDDTLAIKDSQGNSQRDEGGDGVHGNIAHKEATSNEMMNAKHQIKHSNKLQAYSILTIENSQGDSQGHEGDLGLPNGKTARKETISCEMKKAKLKGRHSNKLQGSDDTLAIKDSQGDEEHAGLHGNMSNKRTTSNEMMNAKRKKNHSNKHHISEDSQGDSPGDENVCLPNGNVAATETPSKMTNAIKRKHSNKLQASENESKGNGDGHVSQNDFNGDARKMPSRNAQRKKAKRLWHRVSGSKKTKELIEIQIPENDNEKKTSEHANADQNADVDKEIVPVIVRPGHIRFESSDTCSVRADEPVETLQWNGTTSKKKGQKWGRENTLNKWNDDTFNWLSNGESSNAKEAELVEVSNEKYDVEEVEAYEEPIVNQVKPVKECSENSVAREFEAVKQLIDFESFLPLTRLPEEGDVLVYRMVELSSSWCPELSPFRVGRVSSYECSSSKVILLPLPEYPLMSEEMSEEGQESSSLYKDDGTLEIDFASLVDVRLFKAHESRETTPNIVPIEEMQIAAPVNNQELASCSSSRIETSSNYTVNDQLSDGWEAINQALNNKKAQLQKQDDLDKRNSSKGTTTTSPWSYRALRRNALGPTLDILRSSNGDTGK